MVVDCLFTKRCEFAPWIAKDKPIRFTFTNPFGLLSRILLLDPISLRPAKCGSAAGIYFGFAHIILCSIFSSAHTWSKLMSASCEEALTLFIGAEANYCRIARNLGILLMNSNCFAMYFQQHSSYVCSDIYCLQPASLASILFIVAESCCLHFTDIYLIFIWALLT